MHPQKQTEMVAPSTSSHSFTPTQDLKLLWTKFYYPEAPWKQIASILKTQFGIQKNFNVLKYRYEHYLEIPELKSTMNKWREEHQGNLGLWNVSTNRGRPKKKNKEDQPKKDPQDFLHLYRQIKQFHAHTATTKREQSFQKETIKKQLYPQFEASLQNFQTEACKYLKINNLEEEYEFLRLKQTSELTEQEAGKLEKMEKIYYRVKQMRLQNQKKISKLHRVIRDIIKKQSKCFAQDILVNQMNIGKFLIKVLKSIYENCTQVAGKLLRVKYKKNSRSNIQEVLMDQKTIESSGLSQKLFLEDFGSVEQYYTSLTDSKTKENVQQRSLVQGDKHQTKPSGPLFRKDILKLYYFPPVKNSSSPKPALLHCSELLIAKDGEKLDLSRLVLILKMFKKIQLENHKHKAKSQKELINQIKQHVAVKKQERHVRGRQDRDRMINERSCSKGRKSGATSNESEYKSYIPQIKPAKEYINPLDFAIPNPDAHLQMLRQQRKERQSKQSKQSIQNEDDSGVQIITPQEYRYNNQHRNELPPPVKPVPMNSYPSYTPHVQKKQEQQDDEDEFQSPFQLLQKQHALKLAAQAAQQAKKPSPVNPEGPQVTGFREGKIQTPREKKKSRRGRTQLQVKNNHLLTSYFTPTSSGPGQSKYSLQLQKASNHNSFEDSSRDNLPTPLDYNRWQQLPSKPSNPRQQEQPCYGQQQQEQGTIIDALSEDRLNQESHLYENKKNNYSNRFQQMISHVPPTYQYEPRPNKEPTAKQQKKKPKNTNKKMRVNQEPQTDTRNQQYTNYLADNRQPISSNRYIYGMLEAQFNQQPPSKRHPSHMYYQ